MERIRFYLFKIEFESETSKEKVNILEKLDDLKEAGNRFNRRCNASKLMYYLNVSRSDIEFVLRLDNIKDKKADIHLLNAYISILCKEFSWYCYLTQPTGRLFKVTCIRKLDSAECKEIVSEHAGKLEGLNTPELFEKLFENVEENFQYSPYSMNFNPEETLLKTKDLAQALEKLESLVGPESFKQEMYSLSRYVETTKRYNQERGLLEPLVFPFHYIIHGGRSIDRVYPAKVAAELFYHLGLTQNRSLVRINAADACDYYSGIDFEKNLDESKTGVVLIENIFDIDSDIDTKIVYDKLADKMKQLKGRIPFIISCYEDAEHSANFQKLKQAVQKKTSFRQIDFNPLTQGELSALASQMAELRGFHIDNDAMAKIYVRYQEEALAKEVDTRAFLGQVIEAAIYEKMQIPNGMVDIAEFSTLKVEDILPDKPCVSPKKQIAPQEVLTSLIGLKEVKERIVQISNLVEVVNMKRKLGLKASLPCLHMEFTGNPGTGKTTVARLLGEILKQHGILSKGHFVEVTREEMIGEYIGQTAPKVKKVIDRAKGGVLFLDEAYSLNGGINYDYGYEALAELVKYMEEYKSDLVVIMAGYPDEMGKMVGMNPGLRDRIAFKIEFSDYSSQELLDIFLKMCSDGGYYLESDAAGEMKGIIDLLHLKRDENFGNARLIRKLFERLEILQNTRLCQTRSFNRDEILMVIKEDIQNLWNDSEVSKLIKANKSRKVMGFIPASA